MFWRLLEAIPESMLGGYQGGETCIRPIFDKTPSWIGVVLGIYTYKMHVWIYKMQNVLKMTCTHTRIDSKLGIQFLLYFSQMTFSFLKGCLQV